MAVTTSKTNRGLGFADSQYVDGMLNGKRLQNNGGSQEIMDDTPLMVVTNVVW